MQAGEETDQEAYNDALVMSFGLMDPCDWAAEFATRLLAATSKLAAARKHFTDQAKDIDDHTDADAASGVRDGAVNYLAEVYTMLHSMPMMQQQPQILEALRFILVGVSDINRGSAPAWLAVKATKQHPKRLELETEWVPIIAAMELSLLAMERPSVDGAAKHIQRRTGRKVGTIKDWHWKLFRAQEPGRTAAKEAIQIEIDQIRSMLLTVQKKDRNAIIQRRVDELLS